MVYIQFPYTVQCTNYSKKTVNQLYNYSTVLGAAIKYKQWKLGKTVKLHWIYVFAVQEGNDK